MSTTGDLFRPQALEASRRRLWGDLLLTQPPGTGAVTLLVLGLIVMTGVGLVLGEFTRTERVTGYLVPDRGVLGVQAPMPGVVTRVLVAEGDRVEAGQALLQVSDPRALVDGASAGDAGLAAIDAQLERLAATRAAEQAQLERERTVDQAALGRLDARALAMTAQRQAVVDERALAERARERLARLAAGGHVTQQQLEATERELLEFASRIAALDGNLLLLADDAALLHQRLDDWPHRLRRILAQFDDRRDQLRRERIDMGGRVEFWLRAPAAGRVASLSVVEGEPARPGRNLLTLLSTEARMQAILLVPSRAIGFVAPGQRVRLLYDAFPFTRFGVHPGEVVSVSRSILAPADLDGPARALEPVYKVRVLPDAEDIEAYGRLIPLQAGMALQADLELERRTLWRWLLDPLLALKGRM